MFEKLGKIPSLSKIPFTFVLLTAQAFLLINASMFVKPSEVMSYRFLIMTYMILVIGMKAFVGRGIFKSRGVGRGFLWFTIGLLATSIILTTGGFLANLQYFQLASNAPLVILLTQSLVVAASEEQIFRNYMPAIIGVIPAQVAFMIFHGAAYSLAISSLAIALVAGFVFYFVARFTNSIWTAVGVHTTYNLAILLGWI